MNGKFALEVEGLSHTYDGRPVVNDLHVMVGVGEIFGLLGPNGSGKTTVFRILSTLITPTAGRARIFGIDVKNDPDAVRKSIGVVFQAPSVDGKLTVAENLRHQGHLYGLHGPTLRQRINQSLDRFGLSDRANDFVETLSGGLARRVEIAKAMLHHPGLLLMDEPSTGLDPAARRDLWAFLEALRRESETRSRPMTIILTTHLMEEAENCDRLAILDQGNLVAMDTPAALKAQIGGDAVTIESPEPERLCENIRNRFGGNPIVVADTVRVERENGHTFIPELVEAFPAMITAMTVRRPTLEDVFIQRTGHQFEA